MIECPGDRNVVLFAPEVQKRSVRQNDVHIPDVLITVVIAAVRLKKIGSREALFDDSPVNDRLAAFIGGDRNGIQQQGDRLIAPLPGVGVFRPKRGRFPECRSPPGVHLRDMPLRQSRGDGDSQQIVRLAGVDIFEPFPHFLPSAHTSGPDW